MTDSKEDSIHAQLDLICQRLQEEAKQGQTQWFMAKALLYQACDVETNAKLHNLTIMHFDRNGFLVFPVRNKADVWNIRTKSSVPICLNADDVEVPLQCIDHFSPEEQDNIHQQFGSELLAMKTLSPETKQIGARHLRKRLDGMRQQLGLATSNQIDMLIDMFESIYALNE